MKNEISISIGKASKILGVSETTLRLWEKAGKIMPVRTAGGHRRYLLSEIESLQCGDKFFEDDYVDPSGAKWKFDRVNFWICKDPNGWVFLFEEAMEDFIEKKRSLVDLNLNNPAIAYWFVKKVD